MSPQFLVNIIMSAGSEEIAVQLRIIPVPAGAEALEEVPVFFAAAVGFAGVLFLTAILRFPLDLKNCSVTAL